MYGQFEQVVDQLNSPSLPSDTMDAQTRVKMNEDDDVMNSSIDLQYFSDGDEDDLDGDSLSDDESLLTASLATHHHYGRSQTARMNPLLETISVIEFDSDDGHPPLSGPLYTGSVDSGYKSSSCCPTPDPSPAVKSELDLDHLTSLRRTLLTAIERYDSRTKELIALPSRPNSCQSIPSGTSSKQTFTLIYSSFKNFNIFPHLHLLLSKTKEMDLRMRRRRRRRKKGFLFSTKREDRNRFLRRVTTRRSRKKEKENESPPQQRKKKKKSDDDERKKEKLLTRDKREAVFYMRQGGRIYIL